MQYVAIYQSATYVLCVDTSCVTYNFMEIDTAFLWIYQRFQLHKRKHTRNSL